MTAARLATLALLSCCSLAAHATPWTYRGQLRDGDAPANGRYDLRLQLHGDQTRHQPLGEAIEFAAITVEDGRFELPLEISTALEAQAELWVDLAVRSSGDKDYEVLPARTLAKGSAACWSTTGNAGLSNAFLGTTDTDALQLRSNNQRVVQYTATGASPNILGGHANNLGFGIGVTIAGGGQSTEPQIVGDNYGVIGGGYGNSVGNLDGDFDNAAGSTVSGGIDNEASGGSASIGGGTMNRAENDFTTVGGGGLNIATGFSATVAGGTANFAQGENAVVGGGNGNQAQGENGIVPGGFGNQAIGKGSFAAGQSARAEHPGAFVWADNSSGFNFGSLAPNQMRVRAAGGLHLQSSDQSVELADLGGSGDPIEFMAEAEDAQLYLMSGTGGNVGSVIALGEMSGDLANTWGIARETTAGGNDLRFTFGTNPVAATNTTLVEFRNDGTAFKSGGGTSWDAVSDARLKSGIAPIENALSRLLSLHGVRFEYNVPSLPKGIALPRGEQLGFVAQEVEKVFPEWVGRTEDGYLYIGERGTTALLVEALRELEQRNARLEARLNALEASLRETGSER